MGLILDGNKSGNESSLSNLVQQEEAKLEKLRGGSETSTQSAMPKPEKTSGLQKPTGLQMPREQKKDNSAVAEARRLREEKKTQAMEQDKQERRADLNATGALLGLKPEQLYPGSEALTQAVQNNKGQKPFLGRFASNLVEPIRETFGDIKEGVQGMVSDLDARAQKFADVTVREGALAGAGELITQGAGAGLDLIGNTFSTALKVISPEDLEKGASNVMGKLSEEVLAMKDPVTGQTLGEAIPVAMEKYEQWAKENPAEDRAARAAGNILGLALELVGFKGAGTLAKGSITKTTKELLEEGSEQLIKAGDTDLSPGLNKIKEKIKQRKVRKEDTDLDDTLKEVEDGLTEQITDKKSLSDLKDKQKTDVIKTMAEDPRYHPEINVENKNFNTTNQVKNINDDIKEVADSLDGLFKQADELDGGVEYSNVKKLIEDKVFGSSKAKSQKVAGGENVFKEAQTRLDNLFQQYGDKIPRSEIWSIRKYIDDSVEKLADTNLKKSIRQNERKAFAEVLETSFADKTLVQDSMEIMQKQIEARNFLQKLNGQKIKGGRLRDMLATGLATNIGSTVAGGIGVGLGSFAGIFGAAIGGTSAYTVAQKLGRFLAKNTLTSARQRRLLSRIKRERPDVVKKLDEFKKTLSVEGQRMLDNNINTKKSTNTPERKKTQALNNESSEIKSSSPKTIPEPETKVKKKKNVKEKKKMLVRSSNDLYKEFSKEWRQDFGQKFPIGKEKFAQQFSKNADMADLENFIKNKKEKFRQDYQKRADEELKKYLDKDLKAEEQQAFGYLNAEIDAYSDKRGIISLARSGGFKGRSAEQAFEFISNKDAAGFEGVLDNIVKEFGYGKDSMSADEVLDMIKESYLKKTKKK